MRLRGTGLGLLVLALAGAAWGAVQPVATIDGGGARAGNGVRRLKGTIGALAMLPNRGPDMTNATRTILPGFYGAAEGRIPLFNAADPAWLELADRPAGAIAPRAVPGRLHAFGDWGSKALNEHASPNPSKKVLS
jgi:hypothetical protein